MTKHPYVSFIICTYNRAQYLDETLRSLLHPVYPTSDFELLVIDNRSTDATPEVVEQHRASLKDDLPRLRYVREQKQGLSYARNRGIKEAAAPFIVFVDDDVRATKAFIPSWVRFFKDNPEARAAGGRINVQFDDPRPAWMSHFLLPLLGHHDLGNSVHKYGKLKFPFGGNMGFKKSIFDTFGLFNTDLGRKGKQLKASEEKEWFQRIKEQSVDIHYLHDALLYHRVNKQRLTKGYIRRQAIGLGQSMALHLGRESLSRKVTQGAMELMKILVTAGLVVPYTLALQAPKAMMLVKFRKWIAEGYLSVSATENIQE